MSLLNFPPLNTKGRPFALQEHNGQILTGTREEFSAMMKTFLTNYPNIERQSLSSLQHCISKDDVKCGTVFREQDRLAAAFDIWNREGTSGVVEHLAHATETSTMWPLSRAGKAILKVRNGISSVAQKLLPSQSQDVLEEKLQAFSSTLNWRHNWVRCVAWHDDGRRLAVCQANDYVRVYAVGGDASKAPLTLRHAQQKNVAAMRWLPFDQRVLAVAAGDNILIWRITVKSANIKISAQNAQVIPVCAGPLTTLCWDLTSSQTLFCSTPNSNKVYLVDASTCEVESIGAWTGGSVTGLYPTADGQRLAVTYTGNNIRVYERNSWRDERWSGLSGRATAVVWAPSGEKLLFCAENDPRIYVIHFTAKTGTNSEGQMETHWYGSSKALPVFDASPVEFDPAEIEIETGIERELVRMGGPVHSMSLSKDGQRLSVQFRENRAVVALFIVEWSPAVQLLPCGLIEAPLMGDASIVGFAPRFDAGALLTIIWSGGCVQYVPLIYGHTVSLLLPPTLISESGLDMTRAGEALSESLISTELPSGIVDTTRCDGGNENNDENSEVVLFSTKLRNMRTPAPTSESIVRGT